MNSVVFTNPKRKKFSVTSFHIHCESCIFLKPCKQTPEGWINIARINLQILITSNYVKRKPSRFSGIKFNLNDIYASRRRCKRGYILARSAPTVRRLIDPPADALGLFNVKPKKVGPVVIVPIWDWRMGDLANLRQFESTRTHCLSKLI